MAPPTWTTPEQSEWLVSMKPAFHEARVKGRQKTWHASLCLSWFVKWPEIKVLFGDVLDKDLTPEQRETLAAAELKRKAQLTRWYQNHASESRTARAAAAPLPREVTGLTKTRRAPHAREVYIRMYYDEARRDRVRAALEAARNGSTQPLSRAQTFSITRKTLEEIYEAEPAEVKDAVARRVDTERRLLAIPAANANAAPNRTPEDYQRYVSHPCPSHAAHLIDGINSAINAAPGWLERIVSPIADVCGWCFTVVGAGPSPQEGGEIASFA
ncbi:uncharacterized protein TRAVEDRAFT_121953 [Trametes versicolor FP-101664 SS1]|uniref:uncharacterized protein n=1 Tax=Trametes versicolor (strain FP-101664) TaxID=717944 RepID=UPI00046212B0|nr:uncharacterized protein TRAVEDRAFT_121953 [Trametes versicolor FP-101664 SS1]EIW59144.1 hypothetical protein TRAVEDRAFT_121953 [Trametes versicolor FP-101664 SS1]